MGEAHDIVEQRGDYKYGFSWPIDADKLPPGLDEDVVRYISARKQEPDDRHRSLRQRDARLLVSSHDASS